MKRLIINADDLGADVARNEGIFEAMRAGIVTSATVLPNGPALEHALGKIRSGGYERVSFGVHLNLTEGRPLADGLSCLTGPDGNFRGKAAAHRLLMNTDDVSLRNDIARETALQIERLLDAAIGITHIDGHQHVHVFPSALRTVAEIATRHGIRRMRIPDETIDPGHDAVWTDLLEEARRFAVLGKEARKFLAGTGIAFERSFPGARAQGTARYGGAAGASRDASRRHHGADGPPGPCAGGGCLFGLLLAGPRAGTGGPPGPPIPACPAGCRGGIGFLQGDFFMRPFRLLILTPTALPVVTGNAMTAERWRRSLVGHGSRRPGSRTPKASTRAA